MEPTDNPRLTCKFCRAALNRHEVDQGTIVYTHFFDHDRIFCRGNPMPEPEQPMTELDRDALLEADAMPDEVAPKPAESPYAEPEPAESTDAEPEAEMSILVDADDLTRGDRRRYYGHPLDNHGNTAELWTAYLERKFGFQCRLSYRDVCLMMVLLKVSRDCNQTKRDNLVDIAGYTRNIEQAEHESARRTPF